MPVPHAHVDRQIDAFFLQSLRQAAGLPTGQLGEGRDAAKDLVVMSDFLDALRRYGSSAQHVGQEGTDIRRSARSSEGDEQNGIERSRSLDHANNSGITLENNGDYTRPTGV